MQHALMLYRRNPYCSSPTNRSLVYFLPDNRLNNHLIVAQNEDMVVEDVKASFASSEFSLRPYLSIVSYTFHSIATGEQMVFRGVH